MVASRASGNKPSYVEDDQFLPGENWDFNPPSMGGPSTGGFKDAVGTLIYADDTSSVVTVNFLAHMYKVTPGPTVDEQPFVSGSNIACVFSGQALYPPGT
jgi:hypothetical protein